VDQLKQDDLERARRTPPAVKLLQALELMHDGIVLKRVNLRIRHPQASEQAIDAMLEAWLCEAR